VVVGGSFQNSNLMARGTTRRPSGKSQSTDALGFRCAASQRPGVDMANWVLDELLTANVRPREGDFMVPYASDATVAVDDWSTLPIDAADNGKSWTPPPGYAVIGSHHCALFTPVKALRAAEIKTLEQQSANEGPVAFGFLTSDWRMLEPPLGVGTFTVAYRVKGARKSAMADSQLAGTKRSDGAVTLEEALKIDVNFDHLIFTDLNGRPVYALPIKLDYVMLKDGTARLADSEQVPETNVSAARKNTKFVLFDLCLPCRVSHKGYAFTLTLKVEE